MHLLLVLLGRRHLVRRRWRLILIHLSILLLRRCGLLHHLRIPLLHRWLLHLWLLHLWLWIIRSWTRNTTKATTISRRGTRNTTTMIGFTCSTRYGYGRRCLWSFHSTPSSFGIASTIRCRRCHRCTHLLHVRQDLNELLFLELNQKSFNFSFRFTPFRKRQVSIVRLLFLSAWQFNRVEWIQLIIVMNLDNFRHTDISVGRVSQQLSLRVLGRGLFASSTTTSSSTTSSIVGSILRVGNGSTRCRRSILGSHAIHGQCGKRSKGILLFMIDSA